MNVDKAPANPRVIRWLCVSTSFVILGEISIYHSLADLIGRSLLGREEGLGPAVLAVQLQRVLPAGMALVVVAVVAIIAVGHTRPKRLGILMIGIVILNVGLLIASVAKDFGKVDRARRRGTSRGAGASLRTLEQRARIRPAPRVEI